MVKLGSKAIKNTNGLFSPLPYPTESDCMPCWTFVQGLNSDLVMVKTQTRIEHYICKTNLNNNTK